MIEKLHIAALLPELILLVMAMLIAMIDLYDTSVRRHTTYVLTLMTLVLVLDLLLLLLSLPLSSSLLLSSNVTFQSSEPPNASILAVSVSPSAMAPCFSK